MALKFSIGNYYETYSENDELQKGDVIKKIDDYDARDVRHVDAQNLLQNSESVRLVVERSELLKDPASINRYYSPQSSIVESIHAGEGAATFSLTKKSEPKVLPKSPVPPLVSPREYKTYSPDHFEPAHEHLDEVREERFYLSQVCGDKRQLTADTIRIFIEIMQAQTAQPPGA